MESYFIIFIASIPCFYDNEKRARLLRSGQGIGEGRKPVARAISEWRLGFKHDDPKDSKKSYEVMKLLL
jgi:hypothetical protein